MSMSCFVHVILDENLTQENVTKIIQNGAEGGFRYKNQIQNNARTFWEPQSLASELFQNIGANVREKSRNVIICFQDLEVYLSFTYAKPEEFRITLSSFFRIKKTLFRFEEWEHQDFHWYTQLALALAEGLAIKKLWTEHI